MLQTIGNTIWGFGRALYGTGELAVKFVANGATCGAYNEAQRDLAEAGEKVKHEVDIIVSENEALQEQNQELRAQVADLESQDGHMTESEEKHLEEVVGLQDMIEKLEMSNLKLEERLQESEADLGKKLEDTKKQLTDAELALTQEADRSKDLLDKVANLEAKLKAKKK